MDSEEHKRKSNKHQKNNIQYFYKSLKENSIIKTITLSKKENPEL